MSITTLHERKTGKTRALLATGIVVGLGAVGTLAAFTDTASFTSTFATGSVDIALDGTNEGKPTPYAFTAWDSLLMVPASEKYAPLVVNNKGTSPFTYTMAIPALAGTTALAEGPAGLQAGIVAITGSTCDAAAFAAGTPVTSTASLSALAIATPRTLAPGTSETLCFQAVLPAAAPDSLSGVSVTPTFTLTAVAAV
jgi:predicted ribosomally synthesized peptide with SipW-like signal peptide